MQQKPKKLSSRATQLAQSIAVEQFIDYGESLAPNELIYKQIQECESFEEVGFSVSEQYEHDDEDFIAEKMRDTAREAESTFRLYREDIQAGLIITSIAANIPSNAAEIDIDRAATLGSLLRATVEVNGNEFKLDKASASWINTKDHTMSFEIDFSEGGEFMPLTDGEKVLHIGNRKEGYSFTVDQTKPYESEYSM